MSDKPFMSEMVLRKRMKENYELILDKMGDTDRAWAETFELLEFAIERGNTAVAIGALQMLKPSKVTKLDRARIDEEIDIKFRANPLRAEAERKKFEGRRKSDRHSPDCLYDAADWVRQRFGVNPSTGEEFEMVVSSNPEDALIQALDAARAHGVSLDEFVNNPKYHTAERKAGRPKKVQE